MLTAKKVINGVATEFIFTMGLVGLIFALEFIIMR